MITLTYSERKYETTIQLAKYNSDRIYIIEKDNFLNAELYGGINFHKEVPYIGFQIFNDHNKRLGIGTILLDTLFDFITEYNSDKAKSDKIHYVIGSICFSTKSFLV